VGFPCTLLNFEMACHVPLPRRDVSVQVTQWHKKWEELSRVPPFSPTAAATGRPAACVSARAAGASSCSLDARSTSPHQCSAPMLPLDAYPSPTSHAVAVAAGPECTVVHGMGVCVGVCVH
jgi:hypothetical protein